MTVYTMGQSFISRLVKSGDAISQWINVTFLTRHWDTDADESVCGRCYREANHQTRHVSWRVAERVLDTLFWFDVDERGRRHCEMSEHRDYLRAKARVARYEAREGAQ